MKISYDLHIHSCLSPCGDDDMTPNNIVNMACLLGLDAIAVSDHNSCKNLPAICKLAEKEHLVCVPAVEVCTAEEIHILCYFSSLSSAQKFGDEVYQFLPNIINKSKIYGRQLILNEQDEIIGEEPKLLINALTIGIEELICIVMRYGGVAVPAHVNKRSNSIISILGLIPDEYGFSCIEVNSIDDKIDFNGQKICDSDAHYLEHIHEPVYFLDVNENSVKGIIDYIRAI